MEVMESLQRKDVFAFDPIGPENLRVEIEQLDSKKLEVLEESKGESATMPMVPAAALQMLADENLCMKEDMELKLN